MAQKKKEKALRGLEKIVSEIIGLHKEELIPAHKRVDLMNQMYLFEDSSRIADHVSLGNYYEGMTWGLYGGKLTNRVFLKKENGNGDDDGREEESEEEMLMKPDLINEEGKTIGESKACVRGHSCNLFDGQIQRYRDIQIGEIESRIYFAFYRHSLLGIKSYKESEEKLFEEMNGKTDFSVCLPLSIVDALHKSGLGGKNAYLRRYDGETFPACTILRSSTINLLLSDPIKFLEDFGLNPANYGIQRYLSPSRFKIEGRRVRQFPIIKIEDVDHSAWIEEFARENYNASDDGYSGGDEE